MYLDQNFSIYMHLRSFSLIPYRLQNSVMSDGKVLESRALTRRHAISGMGKVVGKTFFLPEKYVLCCI